MKKKVLIPVLFFVLSLTFATAQSTLRTATNTAFSFGEKITYKVRYNMHFNLNVGEVTFEVKPNAEKVAGKDCYHVVAEGKTYPFYDPFFKVRDKYETYIEKQSILPFVFIRNIMEGGFKTNQYVVFNHYKDMAKSTKKIKKIPDNTQDMLSALYYARTLDFSKAVKGQAFYMTTYIDDSAYKVGMKYMGKENVKTDAGTYRCVKLQPILIVDRVFKSDDQMMLRVTDDANHIPVRVESGISVGKIRADLTSYSGLKNAVTCKL